MSRIPKTKTHDSEGGDLSFAGKDDAPLAAKKLVNKYQGEDKSVAWRAAEPAVQAQRWGMDVDSPEFKQRYDALKNGDRITTRYDEGGIARDKSVSRSEATAGSRPPTTSASTAAARSRAG
jgi:hypothetical protein